MLLVNIEITLEYVRHLASPDPALVQLAVDEADLVNQMSNLAHQLEVKRSEAQALLLDVTPRAIQNALGAQEVARAAAAEARAAADAAEAALDAAEVVTP